MRRDAAERVLALMWDYSGRLDRLAQLVKDSCPTEEFHKYRRPIGRIMGTMHYDIMRPIFFEYPDLEPDWLKTPTPPPAPSPPSAEESATTVCNEK
jgi:hypothetical protein